MKKGQMEIIGFLVIVIIIVVGLLIFLMLSKISSDEESTNEKSSIIVSNMLNTITSYNSCTTVTNGKQMRQVIRDCHSKNEPYCSHDCKEYIEENTKAIIESYGKINYKFIILEDDKEFISIESEECSTNIQADTHVIPSQNLKVRLLLCGR